MTNDTPTDLKDDARQYWNQLRAIDLCRAVSCGDDHVADRIIAEAAADGEHRHLCAGLVYAASSLAQTITAKFPTVTEDQVWAALAERSRTGLDASRELLQMLNHGLSAGRGTPNSASLPVGGGHGNGGSPAANSLLYSRGPMPCHTETRV